MDRQASLVYVHKADINREYFMLKSFFSRIQEIRILVFTTDSESIQDGKDQYTGFVSAIQKYVKKQTDQINEQVKEMRELMSQEQKKN